MTALVRAGRLPVLEVDDTHDEEHARELSHALARAIEGEVRFDGATRAMYATDASNYRQVPIGVVRPRSIDDLLKTIEVCARFDAPLLARGGGTSLAGQCCNVAVVVDTSKFLRSIVSIAAEKRLATVEPGCVLDDLNHALKAHKLMFAPDPATHSHCTLGGMIGNNSCGIHSVMAGRTSDNVRSLDIVTYDGLRMTVGETSDEELRAILAEGGRRAEIYAGLVALRDRYAELIRARFPNIPRRVSGYDLPSLLPENGFHVARALVGSEGTCVTVLHATLDVVPRPPARVLCVLGYDSVYDACDHIEEVMAAKPIGCEGLDRRLLGHARKKHLAGKAPDLMPHGDGWLIVEFGGDTPEEAREQAEALAKRLRSTKHGPDVAIYQDSEAQEQIWHLRESGLGATARVPDEPDTWPGWEDAAVDPAELGTYLRQFRRLLERHGYDAALYGHFGQGCVHCRINFDLHTDEGIARYRRFVDEAADLVVHHHGSLSGEHGDGQARGELLHKMFGPELMDAMRAFKALWDPRNKMNPGKVVDARPIASDLRVGPGQPPWDPHTSFAYVDDDGSFARATLRCVGVGKCRNEHGGTMCPSYRATHEEAHSTRGRALLLYEMLEHDTVKHGFTDDGVKEALDLCLACKGCKKDCPVNVDMATYKAEFLSHYHEAHHKPRQAFAFGYIDVWSRLAEISPWLANALAHAPLSEGLLKWIAGVHPEREIPRFAKRTFRREFRDEGGHEKPRVLLWPDTFNDHFFPEILHAAAAVLDAAGFDVDIPHGRVCCGRPVYDFGMVARGKRLLSHTLDTLAPYIEAGVPMVVLEPSCLAVFQDELHMLFPDDARARFLRAYSLPRFLEEHASPELFKATLEGHAVIHGHCHQKALDSMLPELHVLERAGLDVRLLDSGCCGMAGSFGFEREKYEVSQAVAESDLFPQLRDANPEAVIVADGFSCREQIRMGLARRPLHVAELLHLALHL